MIRPFLKPYTSTIDQLLDFLQVVGDIVFGLAALPFAWVLRSWKWKFGTVSECLDTEVGTSSPSVSSTSKVKVRPPTNHVSTSRPMGATADLAPESQQPASRLSSEQEKTLVSVQLLHALSCIFFDVRLRFNLQAKKQAPLLMN